VQDVSKEVIFLLCDKRTFEWIMQYEHNTNKTKCFYFDHIISITIITDIQSLLLCKLEHVYLFYGHMPQVPVNKTHCAFHINYMLYTQHKIRWNYNINDQDYRTTH